MIKILGLIIFLFLYLQTSIDAHTISIDDTLVTEKDNGPTNATFIVRLSEPAEDDDSFTYETFDGTAFAGSDYTQTVQSIAFPEGALTLAITIPITSDEIPELNEVFFVRITNSTATIGDAEGQCTIRDDDSDSPALSIDSVFLTEGDSGTLDAVLTVTLSGSPSMDVTVDYSTVDGTASSADYNSISNVLTIPLGMSTGTITVPIIGDAIPETNEFLFVNLSNAANATILQSQGTIAIIDNEGTFLFSALFEDGSLDPNWTYGNGWSEASGALIGTNNKKTRAIASPVYAGCSICSISAPLRTEGGVGNQIGLLAWYLDKRNNLEIMMKEETDKWIIKLRQDADVLVKEKLSIPIVPNVDYDWFILYDGGRFLLFLDGSLVLIIYPTFTPQGSFGFQVKNSTGTFPQLIVN